MVTKGADVPDDLSDARALDTGAAAFGLGAVQQVEVNAAGLMNRNWRVTAAGGTFAVKQVLDIDAAAARRQHAATRALADRGRPVPAPLSTTGGDTLLEHDGQIYGGVRSGPIGRRTGRTDRLAVRS